MHLIDSWERYYELSWWISKLALEKFFELHPDFDTYVHFRNIVSGGPLVHAEFSKIVSKLQHIYGAGPHDTYGKQLHVGDKVVVGGLKNVVEVGEIIDIRNTIIGLYYNRGFNIQVHKYDRHIELLCQKKQWYGSLERIVKVLI